MSPTDKVFQSHVHLSRLVITPCFQREMVQGVAFRELGLDRLRKGNLEGDKLQLWASVVYD